MRLLLTISLFAILIFQTFGQDKGEWKDKNLSVTKHQLKIGNESLNYTATTGYMEMRDEKDTLKANLFFIAYTKDGEPDPAKRPILFSFNGGPGSSSGNCCSRCTRSMRKRW